jgi:hypothetical protein
MTTVAAMMPATIARTAAWVNDDTHPRLFADMVASHSAGTNLRYIPRRWSTVAIDWTLTAGLIQVPASTPLPAALPLFATGIGGLGLIFAQGCSTAQKRS